MPSRQQPTRRRLLAAAGSLLGATALAGCGGSGSASGSSRVAPGSDPPEDALVDPPHVSLRNGDREPIVWSETPSETESAGAGGETPEIDSWTHHVVASDEAAAALTFADVDGVDEARAFLDETDFGSETVYVERHLVGECYHHRLCWVRWTDSEIETDYARVLRDADVACEADARDVVTNLIRLPATLEPGQINSYGSSGGGGRCRRPEGGEPTEVDAS
ncbi:hypothetical protein [Halobellus rubicundus]|uniref:Lipoprotein n=1 Tax=Halobellus rubicundus TaxID=2996466 RepID=A0ABD5M6S9_9EURY